MRRFPLLVALLVCWPRGAQATAPGTGMATTATPKARAQTLLGMTLGELLYRLPAREVLTIDLVGNTECFLSCKSGVTITLKNNRVISINKR
jgi:hypothetical protein